MPPTRPNLQHGGLHFSMRFAEDKLPNYIWELGKWEGGRWRGREREREKEPEREMRDTEQQTRWILNPFSSSKVNYLSAHPSMASSHFWKPTSGEFPPINTPFNAIHLYFCEGCLPIFTYESLPFPDLHAYQKPIKISSLLWVEYCDWAARI